MSCEECDDGYKSLVDALRTYHKPEEDWETSEPMAIGGPAGSYRVRSPYNGPCQYKIDYVSNGAGNGSAVLSSRMYQSSPVAYAAADVGTGEYGALDGLPLFLQANTMVPVDSNWYDVRNSENTLYLIISSITGAAYISLQFRQRR